MTRQLNGCTCPKDVAIVRTCKVLIKIINFIYVFISKKYKNNLCCVFYKASITANLLKNLKLLMVLWYFTPTKV